MTHVLPQHQQWPHSEHSSYLTSFPISYERLPAHSALPPPNGQHEGATGPGAKLTPVWQEHRRVPGRGVVRVLSKLQGEYLPVRAADDRLSRRSSTRSPPADQRPRPPCSRPAAARNAPTRRTLAPAPPHSVRSQCQRAMGPTSSRCRPRPRRRPAARCCTPARSTAPRASRRTVTPSSSSCSVNLRRCVTR